MWCVYAKIDIFVKNVLEMNIKMNIKKCNFYLPNLGQCWLLVFLLVAGSLVFGIVLSALKTLTELDVLSCQSLSYLLTMAIPFLYIHMVSRRDSRFPDAVSVRINKPSFGELGPVMTFVLLAIAMIAIMVVIEPATNFLPMPESIKRIFEQVFMDSALWDSILSTCILAPLMEEFLCRGVMMRGMLRTMAPWKAIVWSSLIFGVIHLNPWQAIPAFIIGSFFGWVYYKTHCLWATIFLHCFNNSLSIAITRLHPEYGVDQGLIDILPKETYIIVFVASAAVLCVAILLLNRQLPQKSLK